MVKGLAQGPAVSEWHRLGGDLFPSPALYVHTDRLSLSRLCAH